MKDINDIKMKHLTVYMNCVSNGYSQGVKAKYCNCPDSPKFRSWSIIDSVKSLAVEHFNEMHNDKVLYADKGSITLVIDYVVTGEDC